MVFLVESAPQEDGYRADRDTDGAAMERGGVARAAGGGGVARDRVDDEIRGDDAGVGHGCGCQARGDRRARATARGAAVEKAAGAAEVDGAGGARVGRGGATRVRPVDR